MNKIWINKTNSHEEAQLYDEAYYLSMTPEERLETIQFLREEFSKLSKGRRHEGRKRLRRVFTIIKQK